MKNSIKLRIGEFESLEVQQTKIKFIKMEATNVRKDSKKLTTEEKEKRFKELEFKLYGEAGISKEHLEYLKRIVIPKQKIFW